MARLQLEGPYRLAFDEIDKKVGKQNSGVFALGYVAKRDFYINYVGRSDVDLRGRLLELIGSDVAFKFKSTPTVKEAFLRECELFHLFQPYGNRVHPARPTLSGWSCPHCWMLGEH